MFDTYDEIFARRADSYQEAMVTLPRARRREFEAAVERAGPLAGRVLCDIPAGGGYLYDYLPADLRLYLAVEPAAHFVSRCPRSTNAERLRASIEATPLAGGAADVVVSLAGLHHHADKGAAFREMRRIVKPGGVVVVADAEDGTGVARFLNGFVHEHSTMGHEGVFLGPSTRGEMAEAGLTVEGDELVSVPWGFEDDVAMGSFCRSLFGVDRATVAEVVRGIEDIVGVGEDPSGVTMAWQLRYLVCRV